ncbi:ABC transporter permease [Actinoplanes couchii]|uniref:Transport permease protein n=1 Tax=Actinoplanes couchii TaxID=403638 RepID=A0ABQ3X8U0_9ACTN|nr:ABC transporter permease [Actinoplanes couchii]MDR6320146.1 ABC-2 type transport system permease protein/oleandomycin transport system permease protein [Actinoplanes couchii]GID54840.1 transport permease protein [Actinoplanes couchii]
MSNTVLHDSRVLAGRQLRKTLRRPTYIVFSFIQPVIFVLLFRYVFGGAIDTGATTYVNFLMPGIIVQTAVLGALVTGLGLTEDLGSGFVDRLRSLPMAHSAVLLARTAADLVMNVFSLTVMIVVGLLAGFRPDQPAWQLGMAFLLVLGFSFVFSWISAWIGLTVRNPETAQSAGFIWVFPLTFASSAFVPTDTMPTPVRVFAEHNPVTLVIDTVRGLTTGGPDPAAPALRVLIWFTALLLIFIPLAVRALRRA